MRIVSDRNGLRIAAGILVGALVLVGRAGAVEPAQEFLDAMREKKYHDIALDYLEKAKNNPAVPVPFKKNYLYEKGVTLVEGARIMRDMSLREKQLDDASKVLAEFVTAQADSPQANAARSQLGNVLVERGRIRMEKAKKAPDKAPLLADARKLLTEAVGIFTKLEDEVQEILTKKFPKQIDPKKDKDKEEKRDQLRKDYLQAKLLIAATKEELAETYPAGDATRAKIYEEAAKAYAEIYESYRTRLAGLYARLYHARCFQKLKKHKEAMGFIVNDLLVQPDNPEEFRALKLKATLLGMESWADQKQWAEAVQKSTAFLDSARPTEEGNPEMMELRVEAAKAIKAYRDELEKKTPKPTKDINQLSADGKKILQTVLKGRNDYQDEARKLFPYFAGGPKTGDTKTTERVPPKDFVDAKQQGTEAVQEWQSETQTTKALAQRLATVTGAEKETVTKDIADSKSAAHELKETALYYLNAAQKMILKDSPIDDVNQVRFLLCFLQYTDEKYHEAAVFGEFIARRYPASAGARQSAKIALASYLKLYSDSKTTDKEFESERIVGIADYIVQKWPDQPEAEEALNTLIPFMIKEGLLDKAQTYLDKIPKESPHRGGAELKTGQAMWSNFLRGAKEVRKWEAGEEEPPAGTNIEKKKKELEELKTRAQKTLVDGVARMQKSGEVNATVATSALSLAQIHVDTNESAKAIALLEDPKIGALTLLNAKSEIMAKPGLAEETYKTALRAYISSLATGKTADADKTVKKADDIMNGLKASVGATEEGQKKLISTYVGIAKDLQTQMENSPPAIRVALGKGFENFLKRVGEDAKELNVLNWVGETFRAMGESFVEKKVVSAEAEQYFKESMKVYEKILDMGKKNPKFLPPDMAIQIKMQMAKTHRQNQNFKEALDLFKDILKTKNLLLPVQVEVCLTYQDWAAKINREEKDKTKALLYYRNAMIGAEPDKDNPDKLKKEKNIFWGWGEIARMTASNAKFAEQFHEARVNLSTSRYQIALLTKDVTEQAKHFEQVRSDIRIVSKLYPDLGGPKWQSQYDALLKKAQAKLKKPQVGLKEFEDATPAAAGNSSPKPVVSSPAT